MENKKRYRACVVGDDGYEFLEKDTDDGFVLIKHLMLIVRGLSHEAPQYKAVVRLLPEDGGDAD